VFFLPGEHDVADADNGKAYLDRYGKNTKGKGWYSFDHGGVHFIGLINVFEFQPGFKSTGLAKIGDEQLEWLEKDVKGLSASTPIVLMAHLPLWTIYEQWGWGTQDAGRALGYVKRFGSVTVLNGHIHQIIQKVEGNVTFHTADSTAFPQPAPGAAAAPGPMTVAQRGEEQTGSHDVCIGRHAVATDLQAAMPSGVCSTVASEPCPCGTLNLIPPVLSIRELHTSALWCSKPSGITI
jgi:3',5'-cyclic AMP phosphodiesterase CpdA